MILKDRKNRETPEEKHLAWGRKSRLKYNLEQYMGDDKWEVGQ
jgi:hypothetical protein